MKRFRAGRLCHIPAAPQRTTIGIHHKNCSQAAPQGGAVYHRQLLSGCAAEQRSIPGVPNVHRGRFMKQKIKSAFVRKFLSDESAKKYDHMLEKRAEGEERLKTSMISHLSTLNDGVIAIFITVMMLEIPFPTSEKSYGEFAWSILIFLVSFFIVADFWYDNKQIFEAVRQADHLVIVANFLFLASLALIPVTTKWIIHQSDRYSAIHFGAVYILTSFFQRLLYFAALRKRFRDTPGLFLLMIFSKTSILLAISALLMLLSWFYPHQAFVLYIILPVVSFFMP